jgi:hypothetical protein
LNHSSGALLRTVEATHLLVAESFAETATSLRSCPLTRPLAGVVVSQIMLGVALEGAFGGHKFLRWSVLSYYGWSELVEPSARVFFKRAQSLPPVRSRLEPEENPMSRRYDDYQSFGPDYDYGDNDIKFANPGGSSALRAACKGNPRNRPCPSCGKPNRLTPKDVSLGYQCDSCADALEGGGW